MGKDTNIEWCDSTVNPTSGCDGCELFQPGRQREATCYASHLHTRRLAKSMPALYAERFEEVRMIPGRMHKAAGWSDLRGTERAEKPWLNGLPRFIFVGDMGDVLSDAVTVSYFEKEILGAIESKEGRRHVWCLLTKRPERLAALSEVFGKLPDHVIAMTTVTGPATEFRIEQLRKVKSLYKGVSFEPLWGPVLRSGGLQGIDWAIVGGESKQGARMPRAMEREWLEVIHARCAVSGTAYFFKQWGEWEPAGRVPVRVLGKLMPRILEL